MQAPEWLLKEYGHLKGAKIIDVEYGLFGNGGDGPVLIVETPLGKKFEVFALRDAEGNGSGFLEIQEKR